jgi:hypothetical protein
MARMGVGAGAVVFALGVGLAALELVGDADGVWFSCGPGL